MHCRSAEEKTETCEVWDITVREVLQNITKPIKQCPSREPDIYSASQEIPKLLWTEQVDHSVHQSTPYDSLPSHIYTVDIFKLSLWKIRVNITLLSTSRSPKLFLLLRVHNLNVYAHYSFLPCVLHIPHSVSSFYNTVKPALNGPFIKRKSVLNGNIFRSLDWLNYYSIPWLNGNLASAEKFSGPLRFRLIQVLLY
jgi:hypothetical protein